MWVNDEDNKKDMDDDDASDTIFSIDNLDFKLDGDFVASDTKDDDDDDDDDDGQGLSDHDIHFFFLNFKVEITNY